MGALGWPCRLETLETWTGGAYWVGGWVVRCGPCCVCARVHIYIIPPIWVSQVFSAYFVDTSQDKQTSRGLSQGPQDPLALEASLATYDSPNLTMSIFSCNFASTFCWRSSGSLAGGDGPSVPPSATKAQVSNM